MIINERSKEKNMQKQIALFRGINVSGKNKTAMKDLKAEFGKLGYENVESDENRWAKTAKSQIKDSITIRTAGTVRKLLEMCRK